MLRWKRILGNWSKLRRAGACRLIKLNYGSRNIGFEIKCKLRNASKIADKGWTA